MAFRYALAPITVLSMRPSFDSSSRPLWRATDRLQVGAASLVGITAAEARAISELDGSVPDDILGVTAPRVSFAASLLRLVGAIDDGPRGTRLHPGSIRIEGHGELADAARTLVGPSQAGPTEQASVLLCSNSSAEPIRMRGDALASMRVRHLAAYLPTDLPGSRSVVVGPLVEPGTTSSCLRCQHLIRCDRDPAWPVMAAQLASPALGGAESTLTSRVLCVIGAALAIEQLLSPPGTASTINGTIEWVDGLLRRRSWPRHPECPMH